jgi:hypothetical protein
MRVSFPRRLFVLAALSGLAFVSLSCGGGSDGGPPEPASVVVTPGLDTLFSLNESRVYSAVVLDAVGDPVDGAEVTWSSSDTTVLTVGAETGLVTARKNGAATITALSGELSGTANAFVVQVVTSVTVTPGNASLTAVGDTVRFSAVARDSGNSVVTDAQILWDVNDNTVATIDTLGLATAKGPGIVLVQAQAQARAGYASLGVTQAAMSLVFNSAPTSGAAGEIFTTAIQVEIRDSNGNRVRNGAIPITLSLAGGAGPFGMIGVSTTTSVDGIAEFQNVGPTRAGTVQLTANGGGLMQAMGAPIPVAPAAPAQLAVVSVKETMVAGDTLEATIEVQDRFGNLTDTTGLLVDLMLRRQVSPGFYDTLGLFGQQYAYSKNGVIDSFADRLYHAGAGYQLFAWSAEFDTASGGNATIIPGSPSRTTAWFDGMAALNPFIGTGSGYSPGLTGFVTDGMGNPTSSAPASDLTITKVYWWYDGLPEQGPAHQLIGDLTVGTVAGEADFSAVGATRPGRMYVELTGGGYFPIMTELRARLYGKQGLVAGEDHACVLSDGGAFCWGDNTAGQLSGGGALDSVARPVLGTPTLVALTAGVAHTCGLTATGAAYCWGANTAGQLGRGSTSSGEPVPALVNGGILFSRIDAGAFHTCGIRASDSLAFCWGANAMAQLGDSSLAQSSVPVQVRGGHKFIQISAGEEHTCAVEAGPLGLGWCWGDNEDGEGGNGSLVLDSLVTPMLVSADSNLRILSGLGFSCAEFRRTDGGTGVRCWGRRAGGVIGDGVESSSPNPTPTPIAVLAAVGAGTLAVGTDHACVRTTTTQIYCWGSNGISESFKDGGGTFYSPFLSVFGGTGAGTEIAAGGTFTCVLSPPTGFGQVVKDVRCGGRYQRGVLGAGTTTSPFIYIADADM